MATISFHTIGKKETVNIYVNLSIARGKTYRRKTGYTINQKYWSKKNFTVINAKEDKLKVELSLLKQKLDNLKIKLQELYNDAVAKRVEINADWLQDAIDTIHGKKQVTDLERLTVYFDYYINNLPNKVKGNGKKGVSVRTIQKYKTLKSLITEFEQYSKKRYYVKDVNIKFRNEFINYLTNVKQFSDNYTGRLITFLKTVCRDAKINGIETSQQLDSIKGYSVEAEKIFLNFAELEQIENTVYKREALEIAKDWLIIGCYLGQRVSDLLTLTKDNISVKNGIRLIELTQTKTGKRVAIPLDQKVEDILSKRGGDFPRYISKAKFNRHIKDVARIAGINEPTHGAKTVIKVINGKREQRKEHGIFEKWELVTSHICRRSFATNFYGEIPTALLKSVTGHSTEKQFLEYIGKTEIDQAQQLAEYFTKINMQAKKEPQLKIIKKAN
jgi:integrase